MNLVCIGIIVMTCHTAGQAPPPRADFCTHYRPVHWSSRDTRESKEQNDRNNRVWKALCRGKKQ